MVISDEELQAFVGVKHSRPHDRFGMHHCNVSGKEQIVVRAYLPGVASCEVIDEKSGQKFPLKLIHESGFFEGVINRSE